MGGQNEKISQRDEYQNNGFSAEVIQTTVKYSEDEIFPHLMCEADSNQGIFLLLSIRKY